MHLVSERYWVRRDFWGLLVMRRISRVKLAARVGVTQQQLNAVARHENYTLAGATVARICVVLQIAERERYFVPAIRRSASCPQGVAPDPHLLAS
jgi:DNA-binding Xre family transcriptional regulator